MCRALTVLCVAPDEDALQALKLATVSAEWELAPGATSEEAALTQVETERPHVLVVFGDFDGLVARVRESAPLIRIVADRDVPGATAVAGSYDDVRRLVKGLPRPGGPVR
jgi:hypothetical protein